MKRQFWVLLLVGMLLGLPQPVWADDGFYVIAGGGRVGTAITIAPFTITQSGFYFLTKNLSSAGSGNAITIATSEVTLDLMGFSITGPGSTVGNGIYINPGMNNVEVRNGSVKGFLIGLNGDYTGDAISQNHRFANLKVSDCGYGISVSIWGGIITGCQANNNTNGIYLNSSNIIVDKNTAQFNTNWGFCCLGQGIVTNNSAISNDTGFVLSGSDSLLVDRNSSGANNTANWKNLTGCTVGLNTP